MLLKTKNTKDIKDIKRIETDKNILKKESDLFGKDSFGNVKDYIHAIQFKFKKTGSAKNDIYVFTDGSHKEEKETVWIKNKQKKTIKTENVANNIYGFGVYIESKEQNLYTYGIISNLNDYFEINKRQNSDLIELKALENALISLEQNFPDLDKRNVCVFTDSLYNVSDLTRIVKMKLLNENEEEYKISSNELDKSGLTMKNREILENIADYVIKNKINISWIRGHQGYKQNEIVDQLAKKAVFYEKENFLNNTSRIPNLFAVHTFTEIKNKIEKPINQDYLENVKITQRYGGGQTNINIDVDENLINFKHNNETLTTININKNAKLVIKSEYEFKKTEDKKIYENLVLKQIEDINKTENDILLAKINVANFNSALSMIDEYAQENKYQVRRLNHHINTLNNNDMVENYFLKSLDNNFNLTLEKTKRIENIQINITKFIESNNIKRIYDYIEDNKVFYLSNHKNNDRFNGLKTNIDLIDKEKLNQMKKNGIKEQGIVNQEATNILQKNRLKYAQNKNYFYQDLLEDPIYQELQKEIDEEINQNVKKTINPLLDPRWKNRKKGN